MSIQCEYCKQDYINLSTLKFHQKSAKFCLQIQKKLNNSITIQEFNCEYCFKKFTLKQSLQDHLNTCKKLKEIKSENETQEKLKAKVKNTKQYLKSKYENEIESLKRENERLTKAYQSISDKFIIQEINYKKMEKQLEAKDQYIHEITKSLISNNNNNNNINLSKHSPTVSNSNNVTTNNINNTNSYTINVYSQSELNNHILKLADQYIKEKIVPIKDLHLAFMADIALKLSTMSKLSDPTTNTLTIINENKTPSEIQAENFVIKSLKGGHLEINDVYDKLSVYAKNQAKLNKCYPHEADIADNQLCHIKAESTFTTSTNTSKKTTELLLNKLIDNK